MVARHVKGEQVPGMRLTEVPETDVKAVRNAANACLSQVRLAYDSGMPVVFRYRGYRFFFYSNEGKPREPLHVHVIGGGGEAKFWLQPSVRVAISDGLDARTLRELTGVAEQNAELIERTWREHFG